MKLTFREKRVEDTLNADESDGEGELHVVFFLEDFFLQESEY
jgi:hypothetical protein